MKAISKSLEERAIELIISKNICPIEALKQAIKEENALIEEMIAQTTERSKKALTTMRKNVYGLIHLTN